MACVKTDDRIQRGSIVARSPEGVVLWAGQLRAMFGDGVEVTVNPADADRARRLLEAAR